MRSMSKKMNVVFYLMITLATSCYLRSHCSQLDQMAINYGTDKSSAWHNYAVHYEKYFSPLKDKPIKFVEIGLAMGYSAHMWEEYFTQAQLYFIENGKNFVDMYCSNTPTRSHVYLLDQANEHDLLQFVSQTDGEFDVILDDGGHQMDQQITSFRMLFPALKSGGMYIIEDLATSYSLIKDDSGKQTSKSRPDATTRFLQQLIDEINSFTITPCGLPYFCADHKRYNDLNYYQQYIESIHFYNCMVVIFKR
jgi:predicted O-methyltransferase YrrM